VATKKHKAPPGLDYAPITGPTSTLGFGIVQATNGDENSATSAVFRRLYPVLRPDHPNAPWLQPTCFRHDVLLPPGASDELWCARRLTQAYDEQGFSLKDLVVVVTLRFPEVELRPQVMRLHEAWEMARSFAIDRLVRIYGTAAICIMHVPARAARPGPPHVHILVPARELLPSGFGKFARPLATDEGREIMDIEWEAWRTRAGSRKGADQIPCPDVEERA
jgi:hypothetical protein